MRSKVVPNGILWLKSILKEVVDHQFLPFGQVEGNEDASEE
jgi:hypothetical protein